MFPTIFILLIFTSNEATTSSDGTNCEKIASLAAWRDHNTIVETTLKTLAGIWVSEGCETRPGPEYVLRLYTFKPDGVYMVVQHHYWDDSCSTPKFSVTSHGKLHLRNSLVQPEASSGNVKAINISVIPQDDRAAEELNKLVTKECPSKYWRSWRRNEEHLVYDNRQEHRGTFNLWSHSYQPINNHHPVNKPHQAPISGDISCLGSLKWAFNELKLLKIQLRPILHNFHKLRQVEMELLLGDIHSNPKRREFYSPTSFQMPLIKVTKGEIITVRKREFFIKPSNPIQNLMGNTRNPPHLIEKPHLPPYIWGKWTSTKCEVRPLDVYLLRQFSFFEDDLSWIGEHKFFADPFCTYLRFGITAMGHFTITGPNFEMKEVSNVDFRIEAANLTAYDENVITDMRLPEFCGYGLWQVNVSKDLGPSNGCINLGILLPSIRLDIVKIEMDYKGSWLLFLGQADTNNLPTTSRPTAFQLPLVKCGDTPSFSYGFMHHLGQRFYYSGTNTISSSVILYLISSIWLICPNLC